MFPRCWLLMCTDWRPLDAWLHCWQCVEWLSAWTQWVLHTTQGWPLNRQVPQQTWRRDMKASTDWTGASLVLGPWHHDQYTQSSSSEDGCWLQRPRVTRSFSESFTFPWEPTSEHNTSSWPDKRRAVPHLNHRCLFLTQNTGMKTVREWTHHRQAGVSQWTPPDLSQLLRSVPLVPLQESGNSLCNENRTRGKQTEIISMWLMKWSVNKMDKTKESTTEIQATNRGQRSLLMLFWEYWFTYLDPSLLLWLADYRLSGPKSRPHIFLIGISIFSTESFPELRGVRSVIENWLTRIKGLRGFVWRQI